jgi:hypothetical protein
LAEYLGTLDEQTKKKIMSWHKNGREVQNKSAKISQSMATPSINGDRIKEFYAHGKQ